MDGLSIFSLILLIGIILVLSCGMIIMHDIPYHIAMRIILRESAGWLPGADKRIRTLAQSHARGLG